MHSEIVFIYDNFRVGGAELMIERIAQGFLERKYPVTLLYGVGDEGMLNRIKALGVNVTRITNWDNAKSFKKYLNECKNEMICFTFLWNEYVKVRCIPNKRIKPIFFAVHFKALAVGDSNSHLKKRIVKRIMSPRIEEGLKSHNIICMDEQTCRYCEKYYGFNNIEYTIIRIPIHIKSSKRHEKSNNILSISRFEIPFKGYLLGLIDVFSDIKKEIPDAKLTIISYGENIEKLMEKISKSSYKKDIMLMGKTSYDELDKYYEKAGIYIGMGTTVLDASLRGIPSIAVRAYTEEVLVEDWFFNKPNSVAVDDWIDVNKKTIYRLLENYFKWNSMEYETYSEKSRHVIVENYGVDHIINSLIENIKRSKKNSFSWFYTLLAKFYELKLTKKRRKMYEI